MRPSIFHQANKATGDRNFSLTQTSAVLGSPGYMSPEQLRSTRDVDVRSDIWSLGVILYELVSGRPPFTATTTAEFLHKHCYTLPDRPALFVTDLPPDFDDLICALPAKDPARRLQRHEMTKETRRT